MFARAGQKRPPLNDGALLSPIKATCSGSPSKSGTTPLELDGLLLLAVPSVLTLRELEVLLRDESHQLSAVQGAPE